MKMSAPCVNLHETTFGVFLSQCLLFCLSFFAFCLSLFSFVFSDTFIWPDLSPSILIMWFLLSSIFTTILGHQFQLRSFCSTKICSNHFQFYCFCFCPSIHSAHFFLLRFVFPALGEKEGWFSCFQKVGERTEFLWLTLWTWWVSEKGNVAVVSPSGLRNAEAVSLLI